MDGDVIDLTMIMTMLVVIMLTTISDIREAARQGADLIECDMALTKDHALICSHAPYLRSSLKHTLEHDRNHENIAP